MMLSYLPIQQSPLREGYIITMEEIILSKNSTGLPDGPRLSKFDGMGSCLSLLEEERKRRGIDIDNDYEDSDESNPILDMIDAWDESMDNSAGSFCNAMIMSECDGYYRGYEAAIRDLDNNGMLIYDKVLEAVNNNSFNVKDEHHIEQDGRDCGVKLTAKEKKEIFTNTCIPSLFRKQQFIISELQTEVLKYKK